MWLLTMVSHPMSSSWALPSPGWTPGAGECSQVWLEMLNLAFWGGCGAPSPPAPTTVVVPCQSLATKSRGGPGWGNQGWGSTLMCLNPVELLGVLSILCGTTCSP